jgi:adenylate cyclase
MEDIIKRGESSNDILEGTEREVAIFFSDVRGFTVISEYMKKGAKTAGEGAKNLIQFLNEYMDPMTEIIMEEEGTIDKFIGDAIMAYWNAPNDVENFADKALTAAIRQINYLKPLNEKLAKENKPAIDIGIGLNVGYAVVGEMGSKGRSDYTVIGDAINLGARLESLCKSYGARIIISEYLKDKLTKEYIFRDLDLVKVKGKSEPVEIFEVYNFGKPNQRLKEELELFNKAVHIYRNSQFKEALKIFKEINSWKDKANLKIYDIYIFRCEHYIKEPPKDFDGVWTHTTKG